MSAKVWVVQDNGRNNLTMAKNFGEILTLLPTRLQLQDNSDEVVETCRGKLSTFTDNDSILAAGDPACIGIAVAVASIMNDGIVHMLKFDRQSNNYYKVKIDLQGIVCGSLYDGNAAEENYNV